MFSLTVAKSITRPLTADDRRTEQFHARKRKRKERFNIYRGDNGFYKLLSKRKREKEREKGIREAKEEADSGALADKPACWLLLFASFRINYLWTR